MKSLNKNYIAFILCVIFSATIMVNYDSKNPIYNKIEGLFLDLSSSVMKITSNSIYF